MFNIAFIYFIILLLKDVLIHLCFVWSNLKLLYNRLGESPC